MSLWDKVSRELEEAAQDTTNKRLNEGQRASLHAIAERLPRSGVIIADEVGMGKTRIAVEVAKRVKKAGGRTAILVPPGLGYQWETELRDGGISDVRPLLRSLWSYFAAWQAEKEAEWQPWFDAQLVMLSHAFANWRLGEKSQPWRWALLPELYALWRKEQNGRLPRNYRNNCKLDDPWVKNAGQSLIKYIQKNPPHPGKCFLDDLDYRWNSSLKGDYNRGSEQREQLERCIGLGLGVFDLLIVDEAHKSRGDDSGLSRLLNNLTWRSPDARVICMTATPVELDSSQWVHSLDRIGVDATVLGPIKSSIDNYTSAADNLRKLWRSSEEVRKQYGEHAKRFQEALRPYVLRRDKRDDDTVKKFRDKSGFSLNESLNEYRCEREITVEPDKLSPAWQQAICSAESLSFATRMAQDSGAKRLRLTLGSGHGIASILDQAKMDEQDDSKQLEYDHQQEDDQKKETGVSSEATQDKRQERIRWWKTVMAQAFSEENALYNHPAILATISVIEEITQSEEKVLVFGRYTKPLRALTEILNARAMLRALEDGTPWPQSRISNQESDSKLPMSVHAAFYQLRKEGSIKPDSKEPVLVELNKKLEAQYRDFSNRQDQFQRSLIKNLEAGFKELDVPENDKDMDRVALRGLIATTGDDSQTAVVARALSELCGSDKRSPYDIASAFRDLVKAARDRDDPDADEDGDGGIDEEEAQNYWKMLFERMKEEYSAPRGGFARLMYGGTAQSTRRMLQLAFNRRDSFPKVLVAQSMVGREGLNLHEACRTVVMLHPEWNPGVVEQQIGRVDRVGSYWSELLDKAIRDGKSGDELPRIEVRPVVFKGTYDEHNWKVLRKRWDDLRSQLHGIVIPNSRIEKNDTEGQEILDKIAGQTPDFSPARQVFGQRN